MHETARSGSLMYLILYVKTAQESARELRGNLEFILPSSDFEDLRKLLRVAMELSSMESSQAVWMVIWQSIMGHITKKWSTADTRQLNREHDMSLAIGARFMQLRPGLVDDVATLVLSQRFDSAALKTSDVIGRVVQDLTCEHRFAQSRRQVIATKFVNIFENHVGQASKCAMRLSKHLDRKPVTGWTSLQWIFRIHSSE